MPFRTADLPAGSVAPEFSGSGPVFFLDIMHDDIDSAWVAFQRFASRFRNGFCQFAFLFDGTAFEKLDINGWHDFFPVCYEHVEIVRWIIRGPSEVSHFEPFVGMLRKTMPFMEEK